MRVVVIGASGNVGTSVVRALRDDKSVAQVIGLARRSPARDTLGIEWRQVDIARDDLGSHFRGADAVIHLAWLLQPARNPALLHDVNVVGSSRVFDAVAEAGVGALLYASSGAAYSPILTQEPVDETWPTDGIPTSTFSRQKAYVERLLDRFELNHPLVRIVRLRPGFTVKAEAASKVHREFLSNPVWSLASRLRRVSILPSMPGVVFQAVHTDDVAEAYRLALLGSVAGAFNVAAEPAIDADDLADWFKLRSVPVGARAIRRAVAATWGLGMHSVEPGWIDLARLTPLLDSTRAHKELGWAPRRSSLEALRDLADGLEARSGFETPPLRPRAGTPRR